MTITDNGDDPVHYPGARRPDRRRTVRSCGVELAVYEWGSPDAPPLLLAHGGMDVAATFDLLAPRLADAGWRVVSWDHRGHGASGRTALYSWDADARDARAVMDAASRDPLPVVGHSKGGILLVQVAAAAPHRISHLVNIEGLPGVAAGPESPVQERLRWLELGRWLDHRRESGSAGRKAGTLDDLARRRARLNPRLPLPWLRYLAAAVAERDTDGWRWPFDPLLRGTVGPWRPAWAAAQLAGLGMPVLAVLGEEQERMGWEATPATVEPFLPSGARLRCLPGTGHLTHVEAPDRVAELVLEFVS